MWTNELYDTPDVVEVTLTAACTEGKWIEEGGSAGKIRGIANKAGAIGDKVLVKVAGVFEVPADAADAFAVGDMAVRDSSGVAQPWSSGAYHAVAIKAKTADVGTTVQVKLVWPALVGTTLP